MPVTLEECQAAIVETGVRLADGCSLQDAARRLAKQVYWLERIKFEPIMVHDVELKPTTRQDRGFIKVMNGLRNARDGLNDLQDEGNLLRYDEHINQIFKSDKTYDALLELLEVGEKIARGRTKAYLKDNPVFADVGEGDVADFVTRMTGEKPQRRIHFLIAIAVGAVTTSSIQDTHIRNDGSEAPALCLGRWIGKKVNLNLGVPSAMRTTWKSLAPGKELRTPRKR